MNNFNIDRHFSRRQALQLFGMSSLGYLLSSCNNSRLATKIGDLSEPLNQSFEELLVTPQRLIPDFPASSIDPNALIINTYDITPEIDPAEYRLIVDGEVKFPIELKLPVLKQLPSTSIIMQHICVEGWAAVVQWGGIRLRDLAKMVQPNAGVRSVVLRTVLYSQT